MIKQTTLIVAVVKVSIESESDCGVGNMWETDE